MTKTLLTAASTLILAASGLQAQLVAFSGFEASGDTWAGVSVSGTNSSFSTSPGSSDSPANQRILEGSRSWQTNDGTGTVNFDALDLSAFAGRSFVLTLQLSSTSGSSGNGADVSDYVRAFVALNGAGFLANTESNADINLFGNSNARWGYGSDLTASTAAGTSASFSAPQGGTRPENYSTFSITAPAGTTSFDLRLIALNNSNNEYWNVDSVSLTAVPEPHQYALGIGALVVLVAFARRRRLSA